VVLKNPDKYKIPAEFSIDVISRAAANLHRLLDTARAYREKLGELREKGES